MDESTAWSTSHCRSSYSALAYVQILRHFNEELMLQYAIPWRNEDDLVRPDHIIPAAPALHSTGL
jgi:hypothetical protein